MSAGLRIVGQGLAGTVLAWRCLQASVPFEICDQERRHTASKVAAGLVTPVTGQRLALTLGWDWQPEMLTFYHWVEALLQRPFYHQRDMIRVLISESEREVVTKRLRDPRYANIMSAMGTVEDSVMRSPNGAITLHQAGLLQVPEFLTASRQYFESLGCWQADPECRFGNDHQMTVLCQGPWLFDQQSFDWLPMRYSHGDILTLSIPALEAIANFRDRLYTQQCWLLPGGPNEWRVGSTYVGVGKPTTEPSPDGRKHLEAVLSNWLRCDFDVLDHVAAVRPVTFTRNPLLGRHPAQPHIAVFGGLGSKGVLTAPHYAQLLLDHLLIGVDLPPEVDIAVQ